MTAIISTGSWAKSNTYEAAIDEACSIILIAQKSSTQNPEQAVIVQTTTDSLAGQVNYDINIPLTAVISGTGMLYNVINPLTIPDYASNAAFNGGNYVQDLFNLLVQLENFEALPARNPSNESRLNMDISSSPWRCTASLALNCTFNVTANGSLSRTVQPYLL